MCIGSLAARWHMLGWLWLWLWLFSRLVTCVPRACSQAAPAARREHSPQRRLLAHGPHILLSSSANHVHSACTPRRNTPSNCSHPTIITVSPRYNYTHTSHTCLLHYLSHNFVTSSATFRHAPPLPYLHLTFICCCGCGGCLAETATKNQPCAVVTPRGFGPPRHALPNAGVFAGCRGYVRTASCHDTAGCRDS